MDSDDVLMEPPSAKRRRIFCKSGFREPILNYLKRNANPRLLLKLMQVSKYFWFKEFPFFVVKDFKHDDDKWEYRPLQWPKSSIIDIREFKSFDIVNSSNNLWIAERLELWGTNSNLVSSLMPKVAVCDIKEFLLYNQRISLDELNFLNANEVKDVRFYETIITDSTNDILSVESILNHLPKITNFFYEFHQDAASTFTHKSTKNIIKRLKNSRIKSFTLENIPETFDIDAFFEFMHENPKKRYELSFNYNISVEYVQILQTAVDSFIENWTEDYPKVLISFRDQSEESFDILMEIWFNF